MTILRIRRKVGLGRGILPENVTQVPLGTKVSVVLNNLEVWGGGGYRPHALVCIELA